MIPIPSLTGGAATGGYAANHSVNIVNGSGTGTTQSLARLIQLSQGSSEMGGFTDAWNTQPYDLPDPLRRAADATIPWIPIAGMLLLGFYLWNNRK